MKKEDLKPRKESYRYRDRYGRLLRIEYIKWLKREWFKKTKVIENYDRVWR